MKTIKTYRILIVSVLVCLWACNKDKNLRAPEVETTSVELVGTDVIVTGKVLDDGNAGMILGFTYDVNKEPYFVVTNQILVKQMYDDGTFRASIPNLKEDSTYYFKAFVLGDYGYAIGKTVKYTVPRFTAPEAPCESNLTENKIHDVWVEYSQTQNYSVTVSSSISNRFPETYDITVDCGYLKPEITFSFREKPTTGIYSTTAAIEQYSEGNVAVTVFKSNYYTIKSLQSVYVNRENNDRIVLSFCDLIYTVNEREYSLSGKVVLEE